MKRFLKLIHYEFARLRNLYLSLMGLTLLVQLAGIFLYTNHIMDQIHERMESRSMTTAEYVNEYGSVTFFHYTEQSILFSGPIALCIAIMLLYVFLIWYRDWWGKNMFIYRLLMLPHSRFILFGAKLTVILLAVLGLVAYQVLILLFELKVFGWLLQNEFFRAVSIYEVIAGHPILDLLIPNTFFRFVISYGTGASYVILVFTVILLERSFRWKGIITGLVYIAVVQVVFFLPVLWSELTNDQYLYPIELLWMNVGTGILATAMSIGLSYYLLKNKVSV